MSCAMVYWGEHVSRFDEVFTPHGAVIDLRGKPMGLERNAEHTLLFANGTVNGHGRAKRHAHR